MAQRPSKQRARRGEPAPDSTTLVVRGDLPDPDTLREDATDNFESLVEGLVACPHRIIRNPTRVSGDP